MEKIVFNEYGNPKIPQEIFDAQNTYMGIIRPYLDNISLIEARAMLYFLNMDLHISEYILRRQVEVRKKENQRPNRLNKGG
jgi:hypothetical protein